MARSHPAKSTISLLESFVCKQGQIRIKVKEKKKSPIDLKSGAVALPIHESA
jgi:hypothetical protein